MNNIIAWKNQRGISLIIVLGSLILLTALVLAFLSGVNTELKSSKLYADGSSARHLAQSAVNIVMAEIKDATSGKSTDGKDVCWASQPGMIRTYTDSGASDRYFKLFSASTLIEKGSYDPSGSNDKISASWTVDTAFYADLNQPVMIDGNRVYPIIDGNNLKSVGSKLTYDENNDRIADVDGFYIENAPSGGGRHPNPVPMPVQWLYVLSNGDVVAPTGSGTKATVAGAEKNPIVGRIAFWTDDESSKININTASDAFSNTTATTYWDVPKFATKQDIALGTNQPAQHEYQRYSGHPSTVALSSVFKKPNSMTDQLWAEEIYKMVPRIVGGEGSSKGGTVEGSKTLTPDEDRLYATAGELMFKAGNSNGVRTPNQPNAITKATVERSGFFITANSRSPDVNLFNKPRVSLWPVSSFNDNDHRTPFDRLSAFCSTLGDSIYHFQRSSATSATVDLPMASSTQGVGRNRQLLEYLRTLCSKDIPGFGGKFSSKYNATNGNGGNDCDQILTQIFDYIRSTNNDDSTVKIPFNVKNTTVSGAIKPYLGSGEVVPIFDQKTNTRGFGRYDTIQGAFLLFIGTAQAGGQTTMQAMFAINTFNPAMGYPWYQPNHGFIVQGLDAFTWTGVNGGGAPLPAVNMGFPAGTSKNVKVAFKTGGSISNDWMFGGSIDFVHYAVQQIQAPDTYQLVSGTINELNQAALPAVPNQFFNFTGGDVTIKVLAPDNTTVIQTVVLNFPSTSIPVPQLASNNVNGRDYTKFIGPAGGLGHKRLKGNIGRGMICEEDVVRAIVPAVGDMRLAMVRGGLASQPIQPTSSVYSSLYTSHVNYLTPTETMAHNLRAGSGAPLYGATPGRLLNLPYYSSQTTPYLQNEPKGGNYSLFTRDSSVVPTTVNEILGDWDNGIGVQPDGPYINKADEGTSSSGTLTSSGGSGKAPYFGWDEDGIGATLFSPNRMMSSAGMFGSLPTGVWANRPWQTLLFCPNPLTNGSIHFGFGTPRTGPPYSIPPDYLLLDLFHMPVVEPYAISEPLSTAGRINMNYQIVPFTYINRDTGIRAVLKGEKIIAIPDSLASTYKTYSATASNASSNEFRLEIDADETLKGFEERFKKQDIFRSESEICSLYLVPKGQSYSTIASYWSDKRLTGDNSRERPYTTIYPRLTTKSNTFTVHVWAQTLKKTKETPAGEWIEGKDQITGEYRGSQLLERYVDPEDKKLTSVDFAKSGTTKDIGDFYKFRLLTTKQFLP